MKNTKMNKRPIVSFGIILVYRGDTRPKFLIYQRRDTFAFLDFMRGAWNGEEELIKLLTQMSSDERQRITKYTFKEMMSDLRLANDSSNFFKDCEEKSYEKYLQFRNVILNFITMTNLPYNEAPWGFPKGKPNIKEPPKVCALREFEEETRINKDNIKLLNIKPIIDNYIGTNGRKYLTQYYIAEINDEVKVDFLFNEKCIRKKFISEETNDLKWSSFPELLEIFPQQKKSLLRKIHNIIVKRKYHN